MCWLTFPACGACADLDAFTWRPVTGYLPPGQFQCPSCNHAFRRVEVEQGTTIKHKGQAPRYIPGRLALVPCDPVL